MKLTIRKGVFETNSSSTHAVVVTRKKVQDFPENLTFKLGAFGWEKRWYTLPEDKASYLYTCLAIYYLCYENNGNEKFIKAIEQINRVLNKKGINCTFEHLDELYKKGYPVLWEYDANIDHVGELAEFIQDVSRTESKLFRFLFSPDSFILTGNDNSEESYVDEKKVKTYCKNPGEVYYKGNQEDFL